MDPLSPEAQRALQSLGDVDPTSADEARVRAQLEKTLGVALPVATAATAVGAVAVAKSASSGVGALASLSLGTKVALVSVALVAAASAVTVAVQRTSTPATVALPAPSVKRPPVLPSVDAEPEEEAVAPELELMLRAPLPEPEPPAPAPKPMPRVGPKPAPAPVVPTVELEPPQAPPAAPVEAFTVDDELARDFPGCELKAEQAVAARVRALVAADDAARGLELLTRYQRRCATGYWTYDAWVARFDALCALKRTREVNELWAWFRTDNHFQIERMQRDVPKCDLPAQ